MTSYGSSTVKRERRTNAELAEVDYAIVEAVRADYPVTLRGVYYRVVSAGAVAKTEAGYRLVGRQLLKLRRDGTVPYSCITDGTRWISQPTTWTDLDEFLDDAAASYRRQLWHDSDVDVHVFTEKDAISGVILPVTEKWDVPLGVLRGYHSESFAHSVAEVIASSGKTKTYVYQLGDHDPSGVDAWRAFREAVAGFLGAHPAGYEVTAARHPYFIVELTSGGMKFRDVIFERLAVTLQQISEWRLPTRPTKKTDTRAKNFVGESVEVDAIPASTLRELVDAAIIQHIDQDKLRLTQIAEQSERDVLTRIKNGEAT
jgi:hypothetical protein